MDWILKHKILSIILILTIVVGAWYMLSGSPSEAPILTSESDTIPAGTSDLVANLLALRAVALDATIFSSPSFQSLQDFTRPIVPEPVGRSNPFAPLSAESLTLSSSTSARSTVFGR